MSRPTDSLITDRTSTDVSSKTAKGYYNATDLNRIGNWQVYIAGLLNNYGYYVSITPKTNWAVGDLPRQAQIDKIKTDTNALKNAYYTLSTTPTTTIGVTHISYTDANSIEKILYDIDYLIDSMSKYFVHSGSGAISGMNRVFNNGFRRY